MPRKRKGPKREPSEGAVATESNAAASSIADPSTSFSAQVQVQRATSFPRQTTHQAQTAVAHNHLVDDRAHKRTRHLTEVEEDRLGKLVSLERWIESVGHGRGAAVCICAHVARTSSTGDSFHLELDCFPPDDPSQTAKLTVLFQGQLAQNVSEPLLLLHKLGPPAVVYLSGFAADLLPPEQAILRAAFQNDKVVLKMSPQPPSHDPTAPTSAIWIEQLASHPVLTAASSSTAAIQPPRSATTLTLPQAAPPSNRARRLSPGQPANAAVNPAEPSPPSQLSDWFSTPTPTAHPLHQHVPAVHSAHVAATNTSPSLPHQAQSNPEAGESSTSATRPLAAVVKREALNRSSSSPNPGRTASRSAPAAPAPPRPNAPHVKPRRMGNCLYTPISMVRDGERASIVGVVVAAGDPRRSTSGTRDLSIKITIADASCLSGTGYAKELARSMTVMLFAQQSERIPQTIKPGHIIAVRSVQIQMFSGKPQAVGKSAGVWSWAAYDPVSGDVHASSNFPLASHAPPECSAEEMEHFRDMANWFSELNGVDANITTRSSRPTVKLQEIAENMFFDTVVEVLKVYTHTVAPDLYVTDYTNHTLFYRGNDKYLRLESDLPYPDDTDGWGHVFQISLWDSHATIAEGLQTGDIIRIQNVRPKLNPRGLLTGGLGSSTDSGIKIRTLKATDEARIDLEKRRARFLETLFAAHEEAFADQVEREHGQSSQQRQGHHPQQDQEHQGVAAATVTEPVCGPPIPSSASGPASAVMTAVQSPADNGAVTAIEASPAGATQPPFPTPSRPSNPTTVALGPSSSGNREASSHSLGDDESSLELKPGVLMGPPEIAYDRKPLIRCNAPASIPLTALATLMTTSLCPGMYKVKARIVSTNPAKVEQWARVECKACKRLLPLDQRFCIKCGDEDGAALAYCLRFAVMLEEVDAEFISRKHAHAGQSGQADDEVNRATIPLLFHGRSSEALLPCVDAKALFNAERSCIKTLRRFHNRLLHPKLYASEQEHVLAVYSFPSKEAGRTVRRFAALKELNVLNTPVDLL